MPRGALPLRGGAIGHKAFRVQGSMTGRGRCRSKVAHQFPAPGMPDADAAWIADVAKVDLAARPSVVGRVVGDGGPH